MGSVWGLSRFTAVERRQGPECGSVKKGAVRETVKKEERGFSGDGGRWRKCSREIEWDSLCKEKTSYWSSPGPSHELNGKHLKQYVKIRL